MLRVKIVGVIGPLDALLASSGKITLDLGYRVWRKVDAFDWPFNGHDYCLLLLVSQRDKESNLRVFWAKGAAIVIVFSAVSSNGGQIGNAG